MDIVIGLADLMEEGSTVAIVAQDNLVFDFYLLLVTGKETTTNVMVDDFGSEFLPKTKVLTGFFYTRENAIDMTYKLDKTGNAMVAIYTIRYMYM